MKEIEDTLSTYLDATRGKGSTAACDQDTAVKFLAEDIVTFRQLSGIFAEVARLADEVTDPGLKANLKTVAMAGRLKINNTSTMKN